MNRAAAEWRRFGFIATLATSSFAACGGDPSPDAATPAPVKDVAEVEISAIAPVEPSVGEKPLARSSASVEAPDSGTGTLPRICQDYLARLKVCLSTSPAREEVIHSATTQLRTAWDGAATNPEAREAISSTCQQTLDALNKSGACGP